MDEVLGVLTYAFVFSSRRRHTRCLSDWSSDVCSSDLKQKTAYERSEEHTSELQSLRHLVWRLLLEKKAVLPEMTLPLTNRIGPQIDIWGRKFTIQTSALGRSSNATIKTIPLTRP